MRRKDRLVEDKNEIRDIFCQGKTCRIAIVNDDAPYMISSRYTYKFSDNDTPELYFCSDLRDESSDILKKNGKVCFEIAYTEGVHIDANPGKSTLYYSSIIGTGEIIFPGEPIKPKTALITSANQSAAKNIIGQGKTCHVAMSDDGFPYIVPLSYGYSFTSDNTLELYFHSALEGRKIDALKNNNKACFEIESEEEKFVIGSGEVVFLESDEKLKALTAMFKQQSGKDIVISDAMAKGVCVYKIVSTDFSVRLRHTQTTTTQDEKDYIFKIVPTVYTAKRNRKPQ